MTSARSLADDRQRPAPSTTLSEVTIIGDSTGRAIDDANGSPAGGGGRRRNPGYIEEFGQGRVCVTPGCGVVLSRYNRGQRCWTHEQAVRSGSSESP